MPCNKSTPDKSGADSVKFTLMLLHKAFDQPHFVIEQLIAEGYLDAFLCLPDLFVTSCRAAQHRTPHRRSLRDDLGPGTIPRWSAPGERTSLPDHASAGQHVVAPKPRASLPPRDARHLTISHGFSMPAGAVTP